jgi:prepilin-type N-terminal cleavage/methylation domain-containing protein
MRSRRERAFTLIELLVVIAIIAVLVALVLGVIQLARTYSYRATCMSNLRQLVAAVKMYYDSYEVPPMHANYRVPVTG